MDEEYKGALRAASGLVLTDILKPESLVDESVDLTEWAWQMVEDWTSEQIRSHILDIADALLCAYTEGREYERQLCSKAQLQ